MRIAHIIVCHTVDPTAMVQSIPNSEDQIWYAFIHRKSKKIRSIVQQLMSQRLGNVFDYGLNRGLSKSWNDGMHLALESKCDAIILINDDVVFRADCYNIFVSYIFQSMSDTNIGFITLLGEEHDKNGLPIISRQDMSCCAIFPRLIEAIGYFDENFKPAYYEDIDYMHRCFLSQKNSFICPEVLVDHKRSSTIRFTSDKNRNTIQGEVDRNAQYYLSKWGTNGDWTHPFGRSSYGLRIDFGHRGKPYPHLHSIITI